MDLTDSERAVFVETSAPASSGPSRSVGGPLRTGSDMTHDFEGRVVVVTGAAVGIGKATAAAFGNAGATVYSSTLTTTPGRLGRGGQVPLSSSAT